MFDLWIFPKSSGPIRSLAFVAGCVLALATISFSRSVAAEDAQDAQDAIMKANTIIEAAKTTERAVESWERYASWVNMKTGPTGKERYLSYGMYDLYDVPGVLTDAREAAGAAHPAVPLDNIVPR